MALSRRADEIKEAIANAMTNARHPYYFHEARTIGLGALIHVRGNESRSYHVRREKRNQMAKTPGKAKVLWIEADPVFGGSRSQVQFPVELAPYFTLPRNAHIGDEVRRAVTFGGVGYPEKKMDFHHNDVWRLNLPTTKQGLGGYRHKVLVFEKRANSLGLSLWLVDAGSAAFRRLRSVTRSRGCTGSKQRENGSEREFGYF